MTPIPVTTIETERFADDLLAIMTPLEKAGQLVLLPQAPNPVERRALHDDGGFFDQVRAGLVSAVGGIENQAHADAIQRIAIEESRLGIPLLFAAETECGIETIMPSPTAAAASWDLEAIEAAESAIALEAREQGINWAFSPAGIPAKANSGDDAGHFAAAVTAARIRGLQSRSPDDDNALVACLHFSAKTLQDLNGTQPATEVAMQAIRQSNVASIAIDAAVAEDGPHAPLQSRAPLEMLRRPGGYHGMLLSEWAELAAFAGQDALTGGYYDLSPQRLAQALGDGRIDPGRLDDAVRRVLAAKFQLGLFRSPFRTGMQGAPATSAKVSARRAALDLARKSVVLIRNDPPLLPLDRTIDDILVVGVAAMDAVLPLSGREGRAVSLIEGLESSKTRFKYVPGLALRHDGRPASKLIETDRMAIGMACEAARRARTVVVALGEGPKDTEYNALGEAPRALLSALRKVSDRIVLVTLGAEPLNPEVDGQLLPCVVHAGELGTMSGHAIAEVLCGDFAPTGRLPAPLRARDSARSLPLGFGRSYGDVQIGDFALELRSEQIVASLALHNLGDLAASEVIQLFVGQHRTSGGATGALRGFRRVHLEPGERGTIRFAIGARELGRYSDEGKLIVEDGRYRIQLGLDGSRLVGHEIDVPSALAAAMRSALAAPRRLRRRA